MIMRLARFAPLLALAACQPSSLPPDGIAGLTPGDDCNASWYGGLIGERRAAAEALAEELAALDLPVRIVGPGDAVTREYFANRITVILGPDDRIQVLRCG